MNDHVTKPVSPDCLISVLAKWVRVPETRAGVRPAAGSASSSDLPADLMALRDLDASEGVRRIGGKPDAYRRQLRRFRENYADTTSQLRRLVEAGEIQQARDYCHALKGVTGNIGAQALYAEIAALDEGLKHGQTPDRDALDGLQVLLDDVMREIDGLSSRPAQSHVSLAPLGCGQLLDRLRGLDEALRYDLGLVEPLLAELHAGVAGTSREKDIAAISARVDVFDIDAAQTLLGEMKERLESEREPHDDD